MISAKSSKYLRTHTIKSTHVSFPYQQTKTS